MRPQFLGKLYLISGAMSAMGGVAFADVACAQNSVRFMGIAILMLLEREGTWIGVGNDGWFAGLTNQDDGQHDPDALSRGRVVMDCLTTGDHRSTAAYLNTLDPKRYNPFNLVFGRPGSMFLSTVCPGCKLEMVPMAMGVNVISNDCCGTSYQHKVNHALASACCIDPAGGIDDCIDHLFRLLGNHDHALVDDPFQALCVHADGHSFGTRSTSVITVSNEGDVEYWYSEGHPCVSLGLSLVGCLKHS